MHVYSVFLYNVCNLYMAIYCIYSHTTTSYTPLTNTTTLILIQVEEIKERQLAWDLIVSNTWQHTKEVYPNTYIMDCLFWPPLQLINFTFVPVRLQFLFVNTVSLVWNTFLSLMANKKH